MLTIKTCTQKAKVLKFSLIIVQKRNGSKQYKGTAKRKYDPTFPLKHVFIEGDNAMFNKKYLPKNKRILQTKRPLSEFFKRKVKSKLALKKAVTEEENEELLDVAVTKQRGGTTYFDGGIDESNREFYERIEGMIPKAYYANQPKLNSSTSEWLFHGSPANLDDKPFDLYQKKTLFQNTDVHEFNNWKDNWKTHLATLPIFKKKPNDPFRANVQMANRVSFKNTSLLYKFLSPGGKILGSRYTGVTRRTQSRIRKEIMKSRFLGLIPFTGNPSTHSDENQPLFEEAPIHRIINKHNKLERLNSERNNIVNKLKNKDHSLAEHDEVFDDSNEIDEEEMNSFLEEEKEEEGQVEDFEENEENVNEENEDEEEFDEEYDDDFESRKDEIENNDESIEDEDKEPEYFKTRKIQDKKLLKEQNEKLRARYRSPFRLKQYIESLEFDLVENKKITNLSRRISNPKPNPRVLRLELEGKLPSQIKERESVILDDTLSPHVKKLTQIKNVLELKEDLKKIE